MKAVFCVGTRPEAIKTALIVRELRARGVDVSVLVTGQHRELLQGTPSLGAAQSLNLASDGNVLRWTTMAIPRIAAVLTPLQPIGLVVVQGDTMSALAGARAANLYALTLAHIEAGLRSHNASDPWPEESIRMEIASLADWHYAPTERARENLLDEGVPADGIVVTGNPGVSTLLSLFAPVTNVTKVICITLHRREWLLGAEVAPVCKAVVEWARSHPELDVLWPVHPALSKTFTQWSMVPKNLRLVPPMTYVAFNAVLQSALGVLTDSGGVQEDAATLGVPCVVLRNVLDRPESVEAGIARQETPTASGVYDGLQMLASRAIPRQPTLCYGDSGSAARIATHLAGLLA